MDSSYHSSEIPSFAAQMLMAAGGNTRIKKNLLGRRGSTRSLYSEGEIPASIDEDKEGFVLAGPAKTRASTGTMGFEPAVPGRKIRVSSVSISVTELSLLGLDDLDEEEKNELFNADKKESVNDDLNESSSSLHDKLLTDTLCMKEENRKSIKMSVFSAAKMSEALDVEEVDPYNVPFESKFQPDEMRCLALVAHNHMKPAMKDFVMSHQEILKKFRLTGTNTTMTMLRTVFGNDPNVMYGPTFQSGPLGGDAELCSLMCLEDLGGLIFFMDPLSAHPHQADIDSLVRLANVHNVITAPNPATAHQLSFVLKSSLQEGRKDMIPSFFYTLESPGVKVYKEEQKRQVQKNT